MKIKSFMKYYHNDVVVKVISKEQVLYTGKLAKVPDKLLTKNVYDINPTLNNCNKIVVELRIGRGDLNG